MFERATREWATSPTIQIDAPSIPPRRLAQRVDVEQRLGRVLVLAVAGVDDRGGAPLRDQLSGTSPWGAQHDRVGLVRAQRQHRVLQRLALLDAGSARGEVHHVGREPLGGQLEGAAGARRGLIEEVQHHPPAQRRDLLDLAIGDLGEAPGLLDDPLDFLAVEILDREQMVHAVASTAAASIATSSIPSSSLTRTWTCSAREVGRFLPT